MNKRILLVLVVVSSALFWSALSTEVSLRYAEGNFLILSGLIAIGILVSSYLTYRITIRNQLSAPTTKTPMKRKPVQKQRSEIKKTRERPPKVDAAARSAKINKTPPENRSSSQSATPTSVQVSNERVKGRIRVYYTRRSFGFVENDSGQTIFFHKSAINPSVDVRTLTKKPNVSFIVGSSDRGPIAIEIQVEQ